MISSRTPVTGSAHDEPIPEELEDELEIKVDLIDRENYAGLVAYLERIVDRRPGDAYAVKDLGEAYVMNGEPEKALELLEPLYRRAPQFEAVQWVILDALFALGRDEGDFEWVEVPAVVRLGADALEACFEALARERAVSDVEGLYCRLLGRGYCASSEEELLEALRGDRRFDIRETADCAEVRARGVGR
ncbi:MAG: tetratricopeptide repeat protein [bacterium]|nr:tetratricopeptide repeat protein [bacterium]